MEPICVSNNANRQTRDAHDRTGELYLQRWLHPNTQRRWVWSVLYAMKGQNAVASSTLLLPKCIISRKKEQRKKKTTKKKIRSFFSFFWHVLCMCWLVRSTGMRQYNMHTQTDTSNIYTGISLSNTYLVICRNLGGTLIYIYYDPGRAHIWTKV